MQKSLVAGLFTLGVAIGVLLFASTASAGNIVLTGHDDDFHQDLLAQAQAKAMINFARAGAPNPTLPVLAFDAGSELTTLLGLSGVSIPFTNINPNTGIPAASNFDVTKFSAIVVASDFRCGGCDNNDLSSTNLAGAKTPITDFFNAGGGIATFAAASNSHYYDFLPTTATGFGSPPSTGYVQTAFGATLGIPAVNGDPTHNFFFEPGTAGVSALFGVVERLGDPNTGTAETIAIKGASIGGGDGGGFVVTPPSGVP
ncbi:MAG TPA: hypothetical protein VGJ57_09990, partial [Nitrospirales bacterium]